MKTAHQIVREFCAKHQISHDEINEYMRDGQIPEHERNIHDSRYLMHLEQLVEERDA